MYISGKPFVNMNGYMDRQGAMLMSMDMRICVERHTEIFVSVV